MSHENDLLQRDAEVISEAMKIRFFPFVLDSQDQVTLTGSDGDKLIDFTASWAVANTGYRHPAIVEAVQKQSAHAVANSPISIPHTPLIELAERLRDLTPVASPTKVWFGHSGSEAGDLLSKAIPATGSGDTILNFEGSYHGITAGAATISGHSAQESIRAENVRTLPFPNQFRIPDSVDELVETALEKVKEAFESHEVAGLITEPLQSDGGILVPPDGFLPGVADLCADHDAYFVVDEVKSGLGRTGKMFAFEHESVTPDAVMIGKPLGSGLPISAVIGREELVDFEPASHMMTTAGGPLPAAAGLATLDVIEEESLPERAADLGERLHEELCAIAEDHAIVGDIRGRGLMQGMELVTDEDTNPDPEMAARVSLWARQNGLVVFYVGMNSNVLELTPPLTISINDLETGCTRLDKALEAAQTEPLDEELLEQYAGW